MLLAGKDYHHGLVEVMPRSNVIEEIVKFDRLTMLLKYQKGYTNKRRYFVSYYCPVIMAERGFLIIWSAIFLVSLYLTFFWMLSLLQKYSSIVHGMENYYYLSKGERFQVGIDAII